MAEIREALHIAPIMRFVLELTTWVWSLLLGLPTFGVGIIDSQVQMDFEPWIYLGLLIISIFLLSQFNFPGDKKPHGKMVTGWQRILVEIFSAGLGIFAAWILFGILGLLFQLALTIFAFILDRERWKWFLGFRKEPPSFVLALGHYQLK